MHGKASRPQHATHSTKQGSFIYGFKNSPCIQTIPAAIFYQCVVDKNINKCASK